MSETIEPVKRPQKKTGLGRGLGVLLGETQKEVMASDNIKAQAPAPQLTKAVPAPSGAPPLVAAAPSALEPTPQAPTKPSELANESNRVHSLGIEKLYPNPKQPRRHFAQEKLAELAESIKAKGIIQPILARKTAKGDYQIVAGERRWRAAQLAGLHHVPVIIQDYNDQTTLELALIENIQRQDLNPIEEAEAYQLLMKTYSLTQQEVADKVGKERATVANTLRLLGLVPDVRRLLVEERISMGHAKVLLAVADAKLQRRLAEKASQKKLSVRDLEREVAVALTPMRPGVDEDKVDDELSHKFMKTLSHEMQKITGTKVGIDYNGGKGKISIYFYSDEQLNGLVDRIKDAWQKT